MFQENSSVYLHPIYLVKGTYQHLFAIYILI